MLVKIFLRLSLCLAIAVGQNQNVPINQANQMDFTDSLTDILVNGLISGGTIEQRQLLTNANLASAIQPYRSALAQVVQLNLNAIELLAQTTNQCAVQPSLQSRQAIDKARDSAFVCLQNLLNNLQAIGDYQICLQNMVLVARGEIDALKPSIDACVAAAGTLQGN